MNPTPPPPKNGPQHPWRIAFDNRLKLQAARKEAKRIYERTSPVRNDDFRKLKTREYVRKHLRIKNGIPVELPVMKPWDHVMGRVT